MQEPNANTRIDGSPGVEPPNGDAQSQLLSMWVDDHADALYRFAMTRVNDKHTVEDLLQETYLAALKSSESFRRESSTRTWLIAILRLKIIDYYRRAEKEIATETNTLAAERMPARCERLKAWNCEASQTIENHEFWDVFRACVEQLPATLSRAFSLRELDGLQPTQVCELLQISNKNLAVRVFRARSLLRDCLDKHWFSKD